MEEWYRQNFDHPYPSDAEVEQLACTGGITVNQVKKWMANKRTRTHNTLSFNGSVHPSNVRRAGRRQQFLAGPATYRKISPVFQKNTENYVTKLFTEHPVQDKSTPQQLSYSTCSSPEL